MSALLGIDLGTTYCAVAALDERGQAMFVPNREGEMLTPSAIFFGDDSVVVGQAAVDAATSFPDDVAMLIKRRMGFSDFGRIVRGRRFRPETLSAIVLKKLITDAAVRLGPIPRAVITVPAYFDDTRRKATQDAGRIAGLETVDIFDEPCAAALSYAFAGHEDFANKQTIVVYDLGGGTFDVSIVSLHKRRFQTLAIEGDVRLGGHDWDLRIAEHVAQEFRRQYSVDPMKDVRTAAQLMASAEKAKRLLSKLQLATVNCTCDGRTADIAITREQFELMTRDLLTRTRLTVQQALRQIGLSWPQVDRVLLVGGATHMPMTRNMLRDLSGREPESSLAVSEVVARGAAIHAGILAARRSDSGRQPAPAAFDDVVEIHVNAHSLGVEVRNGAERVNDVLIARNTQLPADAQRIYRTVRAGQRRVRVKILQGEARQAEACIPVGECWIDNLPPGLPARSPVNVTCGCGEDGLISVSAVDQSSGRAVRANIQRSGGMTEAEIAHERAWVNQLSII